MYFLNEDERRFLLRRLLPEARQAQVHPTLRGWHWADIDAPARPTYSAALSVAEIADGYCHSGREVYVRRVLGQQATASEEMREGASLHAFAAGWVTTAKRLIYSTPVLRIMDELPRLLSDEYGLPGQPVLEEEAALAGKKAIVRRFETYRLIAATQEALARQPDIGPDGLVARVLPVVVEQRIDGGFLGLSRHLAVDAMLAHGPMVLDLKFGPREEFHQLSTTGYALALESVYETPVDLGCVVYVRFQADTLAIERDFHFIDDELRTRFLDERDQKQRLVAEEIDPGLPEQCYERCAFLGFCGAEAQRRASPKWARTAPPRRLAANLSPVVGGEGLGEVYVPPKLPAS